MCASVLTPKPQGLTPADLRLSALAKHVSQSIEPPPSPCISVCRMSQDTSYCEGCWRTLDEIADWAQRNADEKREVWRLIAKRLAVTA